MKSDPHNEGLRILIADDHAIFRQGLAAMLAREAHWLVCLECGDGQSALDGIRNLSPDVAILDHSMPKLTGLEVLHALADDVTETRVIVLSSFGSGVLVSEGLNAGAAGWVVKEDAFDDLVGAIKLVIDGGLFVSPSVDQHELSEAQCSTPVSVRELEVLRGLAAGMSSKEVAARHGLSPRTVETYRMRLMAKFSARNSMELLQKAMQAGLLESHA